MYVASMASISYSLLLARLLLPYDCDWGMCLQSNTRLHACVTPTLCMQAICTFTQDLYTLRGLHGPGSNSACNADAYLGAVTRRRLSAFSVEVRDLRAGGDKEFNWMRTPRGLSPYSVEVRK